MYIHVRVCVYLCVYMCDHECVCMSECVYACVCECVYMCVYVCTNRANFLDFQFDTRCTCACSVLIVNSYMYRKTHARTHTYTQYISKYSIASYLDSY